MVEEKGYWVAFDTNYVTPYSMTFTTKMIYQMGKLPITMMELSHSER